MSNADFMSSRRRFLIGGMGRHIFSASDFYRWVSSFCCGFDFAGHATRQPYGMGYLFT